MKLRKAFHATDNQGHSYFGDCPEWARACERAGLKISRVMFLRTKPLPCVFHGSHGR